MTKKLDNPEKETGVTEHDEPVKETPYAEDTGVEEVDDDLEFDEDGNITLTDDDDEDDVPEDDNDDQPDDEPAEEEPDEDAVDEVDDEEDAEEEPQPKPVTKKKRKLSPAEVKLVALKKENQLLKKQVQEKQEKKAAEDLVQKYTAEGYDEDTAKRYAAQDVETNTLKHEVALLRFERANSRVFERYPEAADRVEEIMRKAEAADMTAEEVCRGLFAEAEPAYVQKAVQAAQGESVRTTRKTTTGGAVRSAESSTDRLSREERVMVKALESRFGKPLSKEEVELVKKRIRKA